MAGGNEPHIRYDTATGRLFCTNCGDSYTPNMPVPVGPWLAFMKEYRREHRHCSKGNKER